MSEKSFLGNIKNLQLLLVREMAARPGQKKACQPLPYLLKVWGKWDRAARNPVHLTALHSQLGSFYDLAISVSCMKIPTGFGEKAYF